MRKTINVRGGQLSLNLPEDLPALHNTLSNILKKTKHSARIITKSNEKMVDQKFREYSAAEFEKFFGEGSCEKVFGTKLPSFKAFAEFTEKISNLIKQWDSEQ